MAVIWWSSHRLRIPLLARVAVCDSGLRDGMEKTKDDPESTYAICSHEDGEHDA